MFYFKNNIKKLDKENPPKICSECRGPADFVYFNSESKEILAVICSECRDFFNSMIRDMGKSFCTDPECEQCGRK
jgi:hypothetical protein